MPVKYVVEIEVADVWVADGAALTPDNLVDFEDALDSFFTGGFAHEGEIRARILKRPTAKQIKAATDAHVLLAG